MTINNLYSEKSDPWSSHTIIYKWVKEFHFGTNLLDVGMGEGILGKKCKGLGFYLRGIEPVKEWAEEAKPYYDEILCLPLEQTPDEFLANQDVVVCADVLEHTINPNELLEHLVELQKPHTKFIISVPNIAHIWIRLNLLVGRFEYTDVGILDKSHLRFFTKSTFLQLIDSCGLKTSKIFYTPVPLSRISNFFELNPIGRLIQRLFAFIVNLSPGLFAYQFVTLAEIKEND